MDESSVADYPQPGTSTQHTALMRTKSELAAVRDFSRTDDASASQAAARRSAVPALVALARAAHRFLRLSWKQSRASVLRVVTAVACASRGRHRWSNWAVRTRSWSKDLR